MRLMVVGNPGHRRVEMFAAAARRAGLAAEVVPWRDVASGVPLALTPGAAIRVDSPGENAEVDRLLRGMSLAEGEIAGSARWFSGFRRALGHLAAQASTVDARLLNSPPDILTMFDKSACHARLVAAGIPVPPALSGVDGWESLRASGWARVFVKPRHTSSASGVIALHMGKTRVQATTSVELDGGRLFNSLRVRTYHDESTVAAIVDRLAPDGLHVERWFPKAGLQDRTVDLRVVVVGGRPSHVVVRASRSPMTNLHLGGARGDLAQLRAAAGEHSYQEAMDTCARVAACFPDSLHIGVDLMFAPSWRRHVVAEVNAFGDLLPGLLVDGQDTYDAEVAVLR